MCVQFLTLVSQRDLDCFGLPLGLHIRLGMASMDPRDVLAVLILAMLRILDWYVHLVVGAEADYSLLEQFTE